MAYCIEFVQLQDYATYNGASVMAAVAAAPSTKTGDQYVCPSGTHLLMTIEEVNSNPGFTLDLDGLGVDPTTVFYVMAWGFAFVLACYFSGFGVGVAKGVIKQI